MTTILNQKKAMLAHLLATYTFDERTVDAALLMLMTEIAAPVITDVPLPKENVVAELKAAAKKKAEKKKKKGGYTIESFGIKAVDKFTKKVCRERIAHLKAQLDANKWKGEVRFKAQKLMAAYKFKLKSM